MSNSPAGVPTATRVIGLCQLLLAVLLAVLLLGPPGLDAQATPGSRVTTSEARGPDGRDLPVIEHTLENGMTLLLLPREGPPTVSMVTYVPVGSVHEALGTTGIAHFLEHLLFKGTTTIGTRDVALELDLFERMDAAHDSLLWARGTLDEAHDVESERLAERIRVLEDSARFVTIPNEFSQILSRNGARGLNATTGYEATQYFVNLPSNRAKLWFVMEADRMRNPVFREFYAERQVIAEERRARVDTSPGGLLYESHVGAAFRVHPYGVHPIGHMDDILSISRAQVEEHYRRYYGPNNTTVGIVGDFDADSAIVWAERYFGPLEPGERPPPVLVREPEQRGERRIEVHYDSEPQVRIGWKIPSGLHSDAPALAMLSTILTGGRDARLYRRLVREDRIATTIAADIGPGTLYPGLFTIHAIPRAPHGTQEVEDAILDEISRLRTTPPTAAELERARTRLEASRVRRLRWNQGLAFQLVSSVAVWGDWRETFDVQERMQAVEAEDIMDVLDRYFVAERRTVGILRRAEP